MEEAKTNTPTINIALVSGGKDSQAVAIWAKKTLENVIYLNCDTEWEDEVTYEFLNEFENKLGEKIIRLTSMGFENLTRKKGRFASTKAKFCTEELKIKPTIDFILSLEGNVNIYQGIRWEESTNRASMNKSEDYFKYYFESYGFDKKGKPKRYSYRKKDIVLWLKKYFCFAVRPIISWSTKEVFEYIIDNGYMPNKLYQYGFTRVGCFPCIMCSLDEVAKIAEYRPEKVEYIKKLEIELGTTFFPPNYIPVRFCSRKIRKIDKETKQPVIVGIPSIADVINYVQSKGYGSGLFVGSHCQNPMLPCE
jgi:3'-phosphoadenosine 5'-phosphosulfate sulfotransferase (PAPS reductase)/FAD synthetase